MPLLVVAFRRWLTRNEPLSYGGSCVTLPVFGGPLSLKLKSTSPQSEQLTIVDPFGLVILSVPVPLPTIVSKQSMRIGSQMNDGSTGVEHVVELSVLSLNE